MVNPAYECRKAITCPIYKGSGKQRQCPVSYRGTSLLSCFYKLHSTGLNTRLLTHLEYTGFLTDEQNGFREGRSCEDHIYVLDSLIRNTVAGTTTWITTSELTRWLRFTFFLLLPIDENFANGTFTKFTIGNRYTEDTPQRCSKKFVRPVHSRDHWSNASLATYREHNVILIYAQLPEWKKRKEN